jgi:hypothetical protein
LYINGSFFQSFTNTREAFVAFDDWIGRGYHINLSFNQAACVA